MAEPQHDTQTATVLGLITGGLAHDLNNLLSPILLGVQTLQRNEPDDKTKRILSMIELSSRRAADLIRHLLDYSRRERTVNRSLETEASALPEILQACLTAQQSSVRDVEVHYDPALVSDCLIMDRELLSMIVDAVLQNAWDCSAEGPRVELRCSKVKVDDQSRQRHRMARNGDYACISVKDNGSGMSEEVLKHACEPFYSTHRDAQHPGLGLFLVHTIVKQHEGFLEFESQSGFGTIVRLYVPITQRHSAITD